MTRLFKLFLSITCKIHFSVYKSALAMQPALMLHETDLWHYAFGFYGNFSYYSHNRCSDGRYCKVKALSYLLIGGEKN